MSRPLFALMFAAALVPQSYGCKSEDPPTGSGGAGGAGSGAGAGAGAGTGAGAGAGARAGGGAGAGAGTGAATGAGTGAGAGAGAGAVSGSGGRGGAGGRADASGSGGAGGSAGSAGGGGAAADLPRFSFFVTSLVGMQRLAESQDGFGGDLTYGQADGLSGADKICEDLAEASMPGAASKQWRAFLSAQRGPSGQQVNAIDRIGEGPWYDRRERLVAMNKAALINTRPMGAHQAIINDLPNEDGVPNHQPDPNEPPVDNHHVLTGSNAEGELYSMTATCDDWTSTARDAGRPRIGFSWPAGGRQNWISGQDEGGCGAGIVLEDGGGSDPNNPIVGSGGGYGAIYCFALTP